MTNEQMEGPADGWRRPVGSREVERRVGSTPTPSAIMQRALDSGDIEWHGGNYRVTVACGKGLFEEHREAMELLALDDGPRFDPRIRGPKQAEGSEAILAVIRDAVK